MVRELGKDPGYGVSVGARINKEGDLSIRTRKT